MRFPFLSLPKFLAAVSLSLAMSFAAAKPADPLRCYKHKDPVACFVRDAQARLGALADPLQRAHALGDLLYTRAFTGLRDDGLLTQARTLVEDAALTPVSRMELSYAIDLYAHTADPGNDDAYASAVKLFARLHKELDGEARIELHFHACSVISWEPSLRERWSEFAGRVCSPRALALLAPRDVSGQALLIAMMPAAMAFADDQEGFMRAVEVSLSWLGEAERAVRKARRRDRDFVAFMGVVIHTLNAQGFDVFDMPDASDVEVELARQALHRLESRSGISASSIGPRREVIESMYETGREKEATRMLRRTLVRTAADPKGRTIPVAEQVSTVLLAARLEHVRLSDREGACVADDGVET